MADSKQTNEAPTQDSLPSLDGKTRGWLERIMPLLDRQPGSDLTAPSEQNPDLLKLQELQKQAGASIGAPAPVADVDLLTDAIKAKDKTRVMQYMTVLVVGGYDVGSPDSNGDVPLILAAQTNDFIITSLVIPAYDPDRTNAAGETALIIAARFGNVKSVDLLLTKGANPARKDKQRKSALDYARENQKTDPNNKDHEKIVNLLLVKLRYPKGQPETMPRSTWEKINKQP
jgi:ankyrin repeat protein